MMPKTVQIRDLDDEVYRGLVRRAAEEGLSVPEFLRAEAGRLAARPSTAAWLQSTRAAGPSGRSVADTLSALDEIRGDWPRARS
jgi:hypothetical protein